MLVHFFGGYLDGMTRNISAGSKYFCPPPPYMCSLGDKPKPYHEYDIISKYVIDTDGAVRHWKEGHIVYRQTVLDNTKDKD